MVIWPQLSVVLRPRSLWFGGNAVWAGACDLCTWADSSKPAAHCGWAFACTCDRAGRARSVPVPVTACGVGYSCSACAGEQACLVQGLLLPTLRGHTFDQRQGLPAPASGWGVAQLVPPLLVEFLQSARPLLVRAAPPVSAQSSVVMGVPTEPPPEVFICAVTLPRGRDPKG